MFALHRVVLAALLVGNAIAFAGVDPITRLVTAVLVLVLVVDLRTEPVTPKLARMAAWLFLGLAVCQLAPLPETLRRLLQPGFADVLVPGWSSLSLAPWSTIQVVASAVVMAGVVLVAARMAATRSGLPTLLGILVVTCGLLAVLGLAGESGAPEKVLLFRANTGGGGAYGPFVNSNHFAAAIELSLPAALVLLAAAVRNLGRVGAARQRAAVVALASAVVAVVAVAAVLRSSSRGGVVFLGVAFVLTLPLVDATHRGAAVALGGRNRGAVRCVARPRLDADSGTEGWVRRPARGGGRRGKHPLGSVGRDHCVRSGDHRCSGPVSGAIAM